MIKKIVIICLNITMTTGLAWTKADFTKPAPVKEFKPLGAGTRAGSDHSNTSGGDGAPANVLPISIYIEEDEWKYAPCAAIRLNDTLVLTAAHCLEGGRHLIKHGSRIQAQVTTPVEGKKGLLFASPQKDDITEPNAQVFFYRPGFSADGTSQSTAFDFALVKLDEKLKFKTSIEQEMHAALKDSPEELRALLIQQMEQTEEYQKLKKKFAQLQAEYKQFMAMPLEKFDLLQMTPDVVVPELSNRTVSIYFWNWIKGTFEREPLRILSGKVLGPENNRNTHTLVFGFASAAGASGSPILDVQRHLVVSVESGANEESTNLGGLISAEVCQWVKSHDATVKCLAVECEGCPGYAETAETAAWGK